MLIALDLLSLRAFILIVSLFQKMKKGNSSSLLFAVISCLFAVGRRATAFQVQTTVRRQARTTPASSCSSSSSPSSRLLAAFVDIEERAPRDVPAFNEWADQCGVLRAGGFQLVRNPDAEAQQLGDDWLAVTAEDLPSNTGVLQVPANLIWSSSSARQELQQLGDVDEAVETLARLGAGAQTPQFYLVVKLLVEWERGDQSPWFPWLNSMPRLFFNSVSMTSTY